MERIKALQHELPLQGLQQLVKKDMNRPLYIQFDVIVRLRHSMESTYELKQIFFWILAHGLQLRFSIKNGDYWKKRIQVLFHILLVLVICELVFMV